MAPFDEFYECLPEDSNKRGDYFEKVVIPWFLKTDPVGQPKSVRSGYGTSIHNDGARTEEMTETTDEVSSFITPLRAPTN